MADAPHPGWDDRMTRWVDQWGSRMVQFAATYTGDVDAAQDVAQEAIIRLYQWHRAHPEADLNPAWLYTVTSNLARDYLRRRARRRAEPLNADRLSEAPDDWVVRMAVREALDRLPLLDRQCLWLFHYERWSVEEIARRLSMTPGSVRTRLYRARARFAREWEDRRDTR